MTQCFTIDGSEALEEKLASICEEAKAGVLGIIPKSRVHALVLGGGYGRGEGGVLRTPSGDEPYNDMEFYIVVSGSEEVCKYLYKNRVHHLGEELTSKAGIEIEFKILSLAKLQKSAVSMFYYDLVAAHRVVHGSEEWALTCDHHLAAHRIPLHEATRLLFNRLSGLTFSQVKLQKTDFSPDDADFVGRNLAKAKLAFGDVILAMRGEYHWSCRERQKRLRKLDDGCGLENFDLLLSLHAEGVEFKLHPVRTRRSNSELSAELAVLKDMARQIWLTLEKRRLGGNWSDVRDYSFARDNKAPETKPLKNRLINARQFGAGGVLIPHYPRARLLRTLPLLLWHPNQVNDPAVSQLMRHELRTDASSYPDFVRAYESLWRIYN